MRQLAHLALAALMAAPAAAQARAAASQAYVTNHCRVTLPGSWSKRRDGGMGAPGDPAFSVVITRSPTAPAMDKLARMLGGRIVSDSHDRVLMMVPRVGREGARQYWAVTKTSPSCRVTVTFPGPSKEAEARRIADSVASKGGVSSPPPEAHARTRPAKHSAHAASARPGKSAAAPRKHSQNRH